MDMSMGCLAGSLNLFSGLPEIMLLLSSDECMLTGRGCSTQRGSKYFLHHIWVGSKNILFVSTITEKYLFAD